MKRRHLSPIAVVALLAIPLVLAVCYGLFILLRMIEAAPNTDGRRDVDAWLDCLGVGMAVASLLLAILAGVLTARRIRVRIPVLPLRSREGPATGPWLTGFLVLVLSGALAAALGPSNCLAAVGIWAMVMILPLIVATLVGGGDV